MRFRFMSILIVMGLFLTKFSSVIARDISLTPKEEKLIVHVKESISLAEREISKLTPEVLKIQGMSGIKERHFFNNLCSLESVNYLEIGCWKGSTWISALFRNENTINSAVAIDNWSEFDGPQDEFFKNWETFLLKDIKHCKAYSEDCFKLSTKNVFSNRVNVYFYDGNHSELSQEKAFTYYNDIFDDCFIAVVDDWGWPCVQQGTLSAFDKLKYQILFEVALGPVRGSDSLGWWNGLYIAVIRKPS